MPIKLDIKLDLTESKYQKVDRPQLIIENLLKSRGLTTQKKLTEFLEPPRPADISDASVGLKSAELKKAKKLVDQAIKNQIPIVVYGDYDADGITATAIMWEALCSLGAKTLPFIPHRSHHGYGVSKSGMDEIAKNLVPRLTKTSSSSSKPKALIITVDNGIVAHEGIKYAKKLGYQIILSDHHQPDDSLPPADAVIHTTDLAGAGVSLMLARFLLGDQLTSAQFSSYLGLAAIGSVADMVPLTGANRSVVKYGVASLQTTDRVGLQAILTEADIPQAELQAYQLGFVVGPRLNALGRLESATPALRLLCTSDQTSAKQLATQLGATNQDRQTMTYQAYNLAKASYLADPDREKKKIIIVQSPQFHPGVVGLVAGRLADEFYRPCIVVAIDGDSAKASARSIPGFDITQALRTQQDLLAEVGGHPQAAGFSTDTNNLPELDKKLQKYVTTHLTDDLLVRKLSVDAKLLPTDLTKELIVKIEQLAPFGIGNVRPKWTVDNLEIASARQVGKDNKHLKVSFRLPDSGQYLDAIGFSMGEKIGEYEMGKTVSPVFTLDLNTWNGRESVQLKLVG